jgi:hypothetical protein
MGFQKSQPAGAATLVPLSASTGPLKSIGASPPRTKSARARNTRKSWQHFEHLRTAMARTGYGTRDGGDVATSDEMATSKIKFSVVSYPR